MGLTGSELIAAAEASDPVFWAKNNLVLKGEPWSLDLAPWWAEPFRDEYPDKLYYCSRKTWKSTGSTAEELAFIALHPYVDVAYLLPRWKPQGTNYSAQVLGPLLQGSTLRKRLKKNDVQTKEIHGDAVDDFRHFFLYGVHGGGQGDEMAAAVRSLIADSLVLDEYQQMSPDVLDIVDPALYNSPFHRIKLQGTPNVPVGTLDEAWEMSDRRRWLLTCPGCGHEQPLTEDSIRQPEGCEAYFGCAKCDTELDKTAGHWVITAPENSDLRHGYAMCQAMLLDKTAAFVLGKRRKARSVAKYKNEVWGISYTDTSEQPFPEGCFEGCLKPGLLLGELPEGAEVQQYTLGCDPGGLTYAWLEALLGTGHRVLLDVFAVGKGERENPWIVYTEDPREHLRLVGQRVVKRFDLEERDVAVVDFGYSTGRIADLREVLPCPVWSCEYRGPADYRAGLGVQCPYTRSLVSQEYCNTECKVMDCPYRGQGQRLDYNQLTYAIRAERTYAIDLLAEDVFHGNLIIPWGDPGRIRWALRMFYALIPEERKSSVPGVSRTVYIRVNDDHTAHCAVYAMLGTLASAKRTTGGLPVVSAELKIG